VVHLPLALFIEAILGGLLTLAFALTGTLPYRSPGPSTAWAADAAETQPATRLQVLVKNVHVYEDTEWGEGEIRILARLWRNRVGEGCARWSDDEDCMLDQARTTLHFNANSGDDVALTRSVPDDTSKDWVADPSTISKEIGVPVYADRVYGLMFYGIEEDTFNDDHLGKAYFELSSEDNWQIGEHHIRGALSPCDDNSPFGFCSRGAPLTVPPSPDSDGNARFSVDYEVRRAPLPDLIAENMRAFSSEGRTFYCMLVANLGLDRAESSVITFLVDGQVTGTRVLPTLEPSSRTEACTLPELTPGEHPMGFIVDQAQQLPEMDERNNEYKSKFVVTVAGAPQPQGSQSTDPGPGPVEPAKQADLP